MVGVMAGGIIGPLLLARQINRQRREERLEDYKRQDVVAQRLTDRQDAAARQSAETAKLLLAANERVARDTAATNGKLDVIHTLVNSTLSAALQAELDATVRELTWMRRASGTRPGAEERATIEATELRIQELRAVLLDRLEQTRIADAQAATRAPATPA